MSDIQKFYHEKNVFITGATGFIGKVLLEKLLYSCSDLKNVYILIRRNNPKNQTKVPHIKNRFEELLDSEVFSRLRCTAPNALEKVIPVWGDTTQPGLGMSDEDEINLISKVNIVFHVAATVKFNSPLKFAIDNNLYGTKNVLDFFKKLNHQISFVHLSTAYSNCHRSVIKEEVYPSPIDPSFILDATKCLNQENMESLSKSLLGERPNTYVLSKAIAESYIEENSSSLPVAIVRPSVVTNSLKDPLPGWNDTYDGFIAETFLVCTGKIRNFPADIKVKVDFVPVDFLVNNLIAVAWFTAMKKNSGEKLPVYNMVSGSSRALTFEDYFDECVKYGRTFSSHGISSYPYIFLERNFVLLNLGIFIYHYFPSFFMDLSRIVQGKKPKYLKFYRKHFTSVVPTLRYFSENDFNFKNERVTNLFCQMSEMDKKLFNFDVTSFEWNTYLKKMFLETIQNFTKNSPDKKNTSENRTTKLYIQFVAFNVFLWFCLLGPICFLIAQLL